MAADTDLRRRVTRLENDTESLYELIAQIQSTLDDHSQRFVAVDQRFDTMDQRFDTVDQRFDTVDQRFDTVDQRFDTVDQLFDTIGQRFDTMDQRFAHTDQQLQGILTSVGEVVRRLPEPS